MAKICEIEFICAIWLEPHDFVHRIHECRLAVGCNVHDLVLVAIMRKTQILRQGLATAATRPNLGVLVCSHLAVEVRWRGLSQLLRWSGVPRDFRRRASCRTACRHTQSGSRRTG